MHWYGTISLTADGKVCDLRKLPRMMRAYEKVMQLNREPPDCIDTDRYFVRQIEDAVAKLAGKADDGIAVIKLKNDYDTAHVPVFAMRLASNLFYLERSSLHVLLECDLADSITDEEKHYKLNYLPKTHRWYDRKDLFVTMLVSCGYTGEDWPNRMRQYQSIYRNSP